jgi:hypothetical protein
MQVNELARALHAGEHSPHPPPDLHRLRRRGRRSRWTRRAALAGAVLTIAAVVATGISVLSPGSGRGASDVGVASDTGADTLSSYERRVLREVPDAYAVGGVVVVPGPLDPNDEENHRFEDSELSAPIVPLGWHGYAQPGYVASTTDYPRFMQGNEPKHTQVLADSGPASLSCVEWEGQKPCGVAVLIGNARVGRYYLYGLGSDRFLKPFHGMELFLGDAFPGRQARQSVIGGFDGADTTRVVLTLTDGSTHEATVDAGRISPGDTLFWGLVSGELAKVTAYDADGRVLEQHTVRACSGGVDCEVR